MHYIENVIIGEPIVAPADLITNGSVEDFHAELEKTLFTDERNLARILVNLKIAKSMNEVRRNRPELIKDLTDLDCFWVKWGKRKLFIIVGN